MDSARSTPDLNWNLPVLKLCCEICFPQVHYSDGAPPVQVQCLWEDIISHRVSYKCKVSYRCKVIFRNIHCGVWVGGLQEYGWVSLITHGRNPIKFNQTFVTCWFELLNKYEEVMSKHIDQCSVLAIRQFTWVLCL